ncbi:hypothetical protein [Pseudomonas capsici]|uniref:hypothetical protein n=1 Tax=Pseudomonas capsici TaxID=2810614 RepID=UPI0013C2AA01|nr:hypothetical protein [Pseudomonas capsici]MBX8607982.1 hypothetical protein [Pseudomonas cichorii]MCV4284411.1 hypothetical protein [Pseudomonas capsici]
MSNKLVNIVGLKAICGECEKVFLVSDKHQRMLSAQEPVPCPSCKNMQVMSHEQQEALVAKGNPGRRYVRIMQCMGLFNLIFFGMVFAGLIVVESVIAFGFLVAIGGHFLVSFKFKSATRDLVVQLTGSGSL